MKYYNHYLPSWGHSLLLVLVFFAGSLLAAIPSLLGVNSTSLTYILSMICPLLCAFLISRNRRIAGYGFVPVDEPRKGNFRSMLPLFLLVMVATPFLGALVEPVTSMFPMSDVIKEAFERMFDTSRPVDMILSVSILAPLCEELLCRGIICRGLLTHNKPWFAIVFSAFIFALLHGNLQQGIAAFALGLFMGWVYFKTHSIWSTIAIHFVNNTLSTVMMFIFPDLPMDATYANIIPQPWYGVFLIVSALVVAAAILIIHSNYKDDQSIVSFAIRPPAGREEVGR